MPTLSLLSQRENRRHFGSMTSQEGSVPTNLVVADARDDDRATEYDERLPNGPPVVVRAVRYTVVRLEVKVVRPWTRDIGKL